MNSGMETIHPCMMAGVQLLMWTGKVWVLLERMAWIRKLSNFSCPNLTLCWMESHSVILAKCPRKNFYTAKVKSIVWGWFHSSTDLQGLIPSYHSWTLSRKHFSGWTTWLEAGKWQVEIIVGLNPSGFAEDCPGWVHHSCNTLYPTSIWNIPQHIEVLWPLFAGEQVEVLFPTIL